jgi:glucose/mannose transport system permease protein
VAGAAHQRLREGRCHLDHPAAHCRRGHRAVPDLYEPGGEARKTTVTASPAAVESRALPAKRRRRFGPGSIVKYALAILFLFIVLMPAYVLVVTSFKAGSDIGVTSQWSLPSQWTTASWAKAWTALRPSFIRTFELAIPVALISSIIGAANGFVLSRWRFPGADVVFTLILFGM